MSESLLPEILETDEGKFVVKYQIEYITYRINNDNRPNFFRLKVGDYFHDVSEGISSYEQLKSILIKEHPIDKCP